MTADNYEAAKRRGYATPRDLATSQIEPFDPMVDADGFSILFVQTDGGEVQVAANYTNLLAAVNDAMRHRAMAKSMEYAKYYRSTLHIRRNRDKKLAAIVGEDRPTIFWPKHEESTDEYENGLDAMPFTPA